MRVLLAIAALFSLGEFSALGAELSKQSPAPNVVVSIKPIHSLVAGVMGDVGQPHLLVTGTGSPHTYQMRPSEAKALHDADLIVWIGENLETFLDRPVAILGAGAEIATLHEAAGIQLLRNREVEIWDEGEEEAELHEDEHEGHGHEHREFDMHIWLYPNNARRIVDVVADALARVDPDRAESYQTHAEAMRMRIDALEASLREQLAPVRGRAFIVFHDGYRYFEHAFDLNSIGAVAVDATRPPSAKRISELRETLVSHNVHCVFTEPQFAPDLVQIVIEGTKVRTGVLDSLGADLEPNADAWFEIMSALGESISGCLGDVRS